MNLGMKAGTKRNGDHHNPQGDPIGPPGDSQLIFLPTNYMIAAGVDIERQADQRTSLDQSRDQGLDKGQTWIDVVDQNLL